jgi:hypothetical protein
MIKEGRDLVKEALADAKSLKEAAVESAKKEIVESLAPAVRKLLDEKLNAELSEKIGGIRTLNGKVASGEQRAQSRNPANPDKEGRVEEELTLEDALQEFFPGPGVKENADMGEKSSKQSKKDEAFEKDSKKSEVKEEIEISEAELRKVYEQALQVEVQVKKGFSDIAKPEEIETAHKDSGILPKQGEKQFADGKAPHAKDWIPEARELQGMLQRGLAENKALRENLRKATTMIETLGKKLHEVNLFNAKVLHVNKILNSGARLTHEQKNFVMESIDKARSISEVKMVFETIVGSIKTNAAAMNESRVARPPKANAQRPRTTGTPDQQVLSESVDKGSGQKVQFSRIQELAGLLK